MATNTSQHILSTAANLLGFCLIVITSLKFNDQVETYIINFLTSSIGILLTISCLFSFASIRTTKETREKRLENIADYLFFTSLIGILIVIVFMLIDLFP
jgi:hypothetical protein